MVRAYYFSDPFVNELDKFNSVISNSYRTASLRHAETELGDHLVKLREVKRAMRGNLSQTIGLFPSYRELVLEYKAKLERIALESTNSEYRREITKLVDLLEYGRKRMDAYAGRMTTGHVALQRHFANSLQLHFQEEESSYKQAPWLYKLRDAYFEQPELAHLSTYLTEAKAFAATSPTNFPSDHARALEQIELETELEVFLMLEGSEQGDAS